MNRRVRLDRAKLPMWMTRNEGSARFGEGDICQGPGASRHKTKYGRRGQKTARGIRRDRSSIYARAKLDELQSQASEKGSGEARNHTERTLFSKKGRKSDIALFIRLPCITHFPLSVPTPKNVHSAFTSKASDDTGAFHLLRPQI